VNRSPPEVADAYPKQLDRLIVVHVPVFLRAAFGLSVDYRELLIVWIHEVGMKSCRKSLALIRSAA
jgi:hypothetical protein